MKKSRKKGEDELSTATKVLMELKVKLAAVEEQLEGEKEHVKLAQQSVNNRSVKV